MAVRERQQWAVVGLDPHLPDWPDEDTEIAFLGYEMILRPETEDRAPSIAIPFTAPRTYNDALRAGRRFLSAFAWLKSGQGKVFEIMVTGGGFPVHVGKPLAEKGRPIRSTHGRYRFRLDHLQTPSDDRAWLALALYREALNVESDAYKLLGFFKIINILAATRTAHIAWLTSALPQIRVHEAAKRLAEIQAEGPDVPAYLYESGRCAVAHAFSEPLVDPDDPEDLLRLRRDLPLVQALAEHAVEHDLGVKSANTCYREHLYQLEGFRAFLGHELVARIKAEEAIDPAALPPFPRLSLRFRDEPLNLPRFGGHP